MVLLNFLPLLSGQTEKCLGASVLWGQDAAAEGEDERRRAAGEDEAAPEGPGSPAQTHPEPRGPPGTVFDAPLFLSPALSRLGFSMLLEQ